MLTHKCFNTERGVKNVECKIEFKGHVTYNSMIHDYITVSVGLYNNLEIHIDEKSNGIIYSFKLGLVQERINTPYSIVYRID